MLLIVYTTNGYVKRHINQLKPNFSARSSIDNLQSFGVSLKSHNQLLVNQHNDKIHRKIRLLFSNVILNLNRLRAPHPLPSDQPARLSSGIFVRQSRVRQKVNCFKAKAHICSCIPPFYILLLLTFKKIWHLCKFRIERFVNR